MLRATKVKSHNQRYFIYVVSNLSYCQAVFPCVYYQFPFTFLSKLCYKISLLKTQTPCFLPQPRGHILVHQDRPQNSSSFHLCLLAPGVHFIHLTLSAFPPFLVRECFLFLFKLLFPVNSDFSSETFSQVTLHLPPPPSSSSSLTSVSFSLSFIRSLILFLSIFCSSSWIFFPWLCSINKLSYLC